MPIAWKGSSVGEIFFQNRNPTTLVSSDNFLKRKEAIEKTRTGLTYFDHNFLLVHRIWVGIFLAETSDYELFGYAKHEFSQKPSF